MHQLPYEDVIFGLWRCKNHVMKTDSLSHNRKYIWKGYCKCNYGKLVYKKQHFRQFCIYKAIITQDDMNMSIQYSTIMFSTCISNSLEHVFQFCILHWTFPTQGLLNSQQHQVKSPYRITWSYNPEPGPWGGRWAGCWTDSNVTTNKQTQTRPCLCLSPYSGLEHDLSTSLYIRLLQYWHNYLAQLCKVQSPETQAVWRWLRKCEHGLGCWMGPPQRRWWCRRCSPQLQPLGCQSFDSWGGFSCGCAKQPTSCHVVVSNSTTSEDCKKSNNKRSRLNWVNVGYKHKGNYWSISVFSISSPQRHVPCCSQRRCPLCPSVQYFYSRWRYPRIPLPLAPSSEFQQRNSELWGPVASGQNVQGEQHTADGV